MAKVDWKGIAQARAAFAKLPSVVQRQMNEATAQTVRAVRDGARQRAPVKTGALRKSIGSTMDKRRAKGKVVAKAYYAKFVEFGTVKTPAHPFLMPAGEEQREPYVQRALDAGQRIGAEMQEKSRP